MNNAFPLLSKLPALLVLLTVSFFSNGGVQAEEKVTFNFVDVDLPVVAKYVSDITGKNFIFDEKFQGKVTIIAPSKLSTKDGFRLFTSVLELKGFTVVPSGVNAYKIIPTSVAKQKGMIVRDSGRTVNESYIARLIQLEYISSDEAVKFLRPIVSKDGYLSSFGPGNLILIIDSGLNIQKILSITEKIDQPSTIEVPEIVFLEHASAEDIAKVLNEGMQSGTPAQRGKPSQRTSGMVVADTRLNAVIIFGPKEVRESMKRLIALLDVPSDEEYGRINVYFLENADAEDVSKVLQGVIKGIEQTKRKAKQRGAPQVMKSDQDIIVTPDPSTNSLVILASPADYRNLVAVIKKLDMRKRQVYVEAMIVEASIDDLLEMGSKWRLTATINDEPVVIGGVGIMNQNALQSVVEGLSGLSLGGLGNFLDVPITTVGSDGSIDTSTITVPGYAALFSLSEFQGIINVVSTPQILTSDNEEAEIVVGENVPFITRRESDPTRDVSVFSDIERQDVGVKLTITPQIAEGDYVRLDVYQEISQIIQASLAEDIFTSIGPSTTMRSTKTSVIIKDSQTVVIGGLMQEREEENITKVPILGDIPLLGWLFKFKATSKEKINLLVFITPHIIRDAEDLDNLSHRKGLDYARITNQYVPGQVLVRFRQEMSREEIESLVNGQGASLLSYIETLNVYVIRISDSMDVEEAVDEFLSLSEVEFVEPNYQFKGMSLQSSTRNRKDSGYIYNPTGAKEDEDY